MKYRESSMNSQSAAVVQGIHGSPPSWFMVARALVTIGSWAVEEDIFFARVAYGSNMEVLILSFEQGDFLVIIAGFNFVLPRKGISGSHVNSPFYAPLNVIFLEE